MSQRYQHYDTSALPDRLAMVLAILVLVVLATVFRTLLRLGPRRSKDPEERARAAAGKASRNRQARLRERRTALQKKAGQRNSP